MGPIPNFRNKHRTRLKRHDWNKRVESAELFGAISTLVLGGLGPICLSSRFVIQPVLPQVRLRNVDLEAILSLEFPVTVRAYGCSGEQKIPDISLLIPDS